MLVGLSAQGHETEIGTFDKLLGADLRQLTLRWLRAGYGLTAGDGRASRLARDIADTLPLLHWHVELAEIVKAAERRTPEFESFLTAWRVNLREDVGAWRHATRLRDKLEREAALLAGAADGLGATLAQHETGGAVRMSDPLTPRFSSSLTFKRRSARRRRCDRASFQMRRCAFQTPTSRKLRTADSVSPTTTRPASASPCWSIT